MDSQLGLSNSQKEELQITTKREVWGILGDTFEERWILYTEIIMSWPALTL